MLQNFSEQTAKSFPGSTRNILARLVERSKQESPQKPESSEPQPIDDMSSAELKGIVAQDDCDNETMHVSAYMPDIFTGTLIPCIEKGTQSWLDDRASKESVCGFLRALRTLYSSENKKDHDHADALLDLSAARVIVHGQKSAEGFFIEVARKIN